MAPQTAARTCKLVTRQPRATGERGLRPTISVLRTAPRHLRATSTQTVSRKTRRTAPRTCMPYTDTRTCRTFELIRTSTSVTILSRRPPTRLHRRTSPTCTVGRTSSPVRPVLASRRHRRTPTRSASSTLHRTPTRTSPPCISTGE